MFSTIILRDIPKQVAQIDLWSYDIEGGFRGFQSIPSGIHYVSILVDGIHDGFWITLSPDTIVVKVFDLLQRKFVDDTSDSTAYYQELAASGAMIDVLHPYPQADWFDWWELTQHINANSDEVPQLHQEVIPQPPNQLSPSDLADWMQHHHKSRFELALLETHQGSPSAFLAEFQFAFVRWLVTSEYGSEQEDLEAFNRWRHLLASTYHAGDRAISEHPQLFCQFVDALLAQVAYLPDWLLTPDSFVIKNAHDLAEDLIDTKFAELAEQGQALSEWLQVVAYP